jgi:hypothetical protein
MAKVVKNPIVRGISGSVGRLVFRQMPDGSTWVSATPDFSKRKFSNGQKNHQRRFKEAAAHAREAAKTQPIYAQIAAGTMKTAYNIALSDWFNPPVIHCVERQDGRIRIQASDNVMVTQVRVMILGKDETVLDQGDAVKVDDLWWEYVSDKAGTILAEARDLAGNVVMERMD